MIETNQKQRGSTLWNLVDPLHGAMDADDFGDDMFSYLLFRSLPNSNETEAKRGLMQQFYSSPEEAVA